LIEKFLCKKELTDATVMITIKVKFSTCYGLDVWMIGVRFPAEAGDFSLHCRVQTGFGAHPASYPMSSGVPFSGGKAAGE
jgi:hypothetical protein